MAGGNCSPIAGRVVDRSPIGDTAAPGNCCCRSTTPFSLQVDAQVREQPAPNLTPATIPGGTAGQCQLYTGRVEEIVPAWRPRNAYLHRKSTSPVPGFAADVRFRLLVPPAAWKGR